VLSYDEGIDLLPCQRLAILLGELSIDKKSQVLQFGINIQIELPDILYELIQGMMEIILDLINYRNICIVWVHNTQRFNLLCYVMKLTGYFINM
jgi:hypothetical protein